MTRWVALLLLFWGCREEQSLNGNLPLIRCRDNWIYDVQRDSRMEVFGETSWEAASVFITHPPILKHDTDGQTGSFSLLLTPYDQATFLTYRARVDTNENTYRVSLWFKILPDRPRRVVVAMGSSFIDLPVEDVAYDVWEYVEFLTTLHQRNVLVVIQLWDYPNKHSKLKIDNVIITDCVNGNT